MSNVLEEIAAEVGAPNIQAGAFSVAHFSFELCSSCLHSLVAIAYVMQKTPYVFPIIGGRKVEHLHANIAALDIALTDEHIKKIEAASPFDKGTMYTLFVCCLPFLCSRTLLLTLSLNRATVPSTALSTVMLVTSTGGLLRLPFAHPRTRCDANFLRIVQMSLSRHNSLYESEYDVDIKSTYRRIKSSSTLFAAPSTSEL